MAIFDKIKKTTIAKRKTDEMLYSVIAKEMEEGVRHNGLWLKALEHAGGNKERQIAEYIKLRVQSLRDDVSSSSDQGYPKKQIEKTLDIEVFIKMLSNNKSIGIIEKYFEEMNFREIKEFINTPDSCEDYPIHVSVKQGRIELLKWLLEAGANPDVRNYWGTTALEIAERNEDQDATSLLIRYKK